MLNKTTGKKDNRTILFMIYFAFLICTQIAAQEKNDQEEFKDLLKNYSLEELLNINVVTASKVEQKVSDAPATIISISNEQIEKYGWQDLKDIFKSLPGFNVSYNSQGEIKTLVIMRGILGNQKILILQDGKKYNPTTGERFVYGNNIPLNIYKRIEIVYGPASALYGADAFSGVINLITKDGADINGIIASAGYVSTGSYVADFTFGKEIDDKTDFLFGVRLYQGRDAELHKDYSEYGRFVNDYNGSLGRLENSYPIKNWNFLFKLNYGKFTFGADWQHMLETNAYTTIPTNYAYVKNNVWGQDLRHVYVEYKDALSKEINLDAKITAGEYEVNPRSNFYIITNKELSEGLPSYKYSYSGYVKGLVQLEFQIGKRLSVLSGISYETVTSFPKTKNLYDKPFHLDGDLIDDLSEFVDNNGYTFGVIGLAESKFGERNYSDYGVFLQSDIKLTKNLNILLGGRFDYNSIYKETINPRAGIVYKPIENLSLKLLFGTAFIAPSNYYRWENWANPFAMHIPNEQIEPEKLKNYSFSAVYFITDDLSIRGELFRNDLQNVIRPIEAKPQKDNYPYYNPLAISGNPYESFLDSPEGYRVEINDNQGEIFTQGFEVELQYKLGMLMTSFSYSFLDGEDNGRNLSKISKHTIIGNIDYSSSKYTFALTARYFSDIQTAIGNSKYQGETFNGSAIVYFNANYKLNQNISLFLNIDNLFNTKHFSAAPYGESIWILPRAPQALREIFVGLKTKF